MNEANSMIALGPFVWCAVTTVIGVVGLLVSERQDYQLGRWFFKPMACLGFIAGVFVLQPLRSTYGIGITIGLVLSIIGDLCLIPRGSGKTFLLGIGAFLLAHVAYAFSFMAFGYSMLWSMIAFFPLAAIGVFVFRWLQPDVPPELQRPVLGYVMVITWMVAMAIGTFAVHTEFLLIPVAAIMFWASDISVARARFKDANFSNKVWGIPMYFGAQLMFALTTIFAAKPS
jgi:uncharacterized membrane protein YhhN